MGHTGDDAMLKFLVLVQFDILFRLRYQKMDVVLVQCFFNSLGSVQSVIVSIGTSCIVEHPDITTVYWSASPNASLSQQLCEFKIFVRVMRGSQTRDKCQPMQKDRSLNIPLF